MNIYDEIGVTPVINAAGTLTGYGGSLMLPEVVDAMAAASRAFVPIEELHEAAGRRIAEMLGVEAAHVCGCASAGIALMAAACIAGTDSARIERLPDASGMKSKFVVQKAHRNWFDRAVRVAGGRFVEIGDRPEELAASLDGEVAAVYFTLAWFCTGSAMPLAQVAEIAHRVGVPVIADAAAEIPPLENLSRFVKEGADLVVFSGGKALRGPQASGLILGRKDLILACQANDSPHMAVGRSMKAGKEEIAGLVRAVELYVKKDHAAEMALWERRVANFVESLGSISGLNVFRQMPHGIGQQIPHAVLQWDPEARGQTYAEFQQRLLSGQPRVAVQLVTPEAYDTTDFPAPEIRLHPHTLQDGEEDVVVQRIREELQRG